MPRGKHGHHGHRGATDRDRGDHPRSRTRAHRGDVATAILILLSEQPMHGYQLMQAVQARTLGGWRISPGAIYPTLAQLEDEGSITVTDDGGRRLATLTARGAEHLSERIAQLGDPFVERGPGPGPDLREAVEALQSAAREVSAVGTTSQRDAAAEVLAEARRALYRLLADG